MFFFIISLYQIIRPPEPPEPPEPQLRYKFKFEKRGLHGNEFEDCLTSKVDQLLEGIELKRIKTLKGDAIKDVRREVCIRENKSNPHLDRRCPRGINNAIRGGVLRHNDDTPMAHQNHPAEQGGRKLNKNLSDFYHDKQRQLFEDHLLTHEELRDLLPDIKVDPDKNRKGYILHHDGIKWNQLNGTDFCNVIDEISVFFLRELKKLSQENREAFRNQWGNTLEAVYKCCLDISVWRNAVDWCFDNDLMALSSRQGYKDWKDHLMVLISFSALMAVVDMFRKKLGAP